MKPRHILATLIKKVMDNTITASEHSLLMQMMEEIPDNEIEDILSGLWDTHEVQTEMSPDSKQEIFKQISYKIIQSNTPKRKSIFTSGIKKIYSGVASVLLPIFMVALAAYILLSGSQPERFITRTEPGEKSYILLPDSSGVWLNSGSELIYYSDYNNNRVISLKGEGYFVVQNKENKHFVVSLDNTNVVVKGTTFNISSYDTDSTVEISLVEGKVAIENKLDNKIYAHLSPDQRFVYPKENVNNWYVEDCDAELSGVWHNGLLIFSNATVTEVFRKMERWYGVNIVVENPKDELIYGFTIKSESLTEMLHLINKITPIDYKINGKEVKVRYK